MTVHERFRAWLAWTGLSEAEIARRLGCDASYPRKIRLGERQVGLDLAFAIESLSSKPREDGEVWPAGPIRASEWVSHPPTIAPTTPPVESAS